jgi:hypothetical protein
LIGILSIYLNGLARARGMLPHAAKLDKNESISVDAYLIHEIKCRLSNTSRIKYSDLSLLGGGISGI